jgi:hypothetical protein
MASGLLTRNFNIVNSNGGHEMSSYINYENARAHNNDLWRQAEQNGRLARHAVSKSARPRMRHLPGSLVRGTRVA